MIRPLAISLALATGASASPMEREAGLPHVYTPDLTLAEAMDLGLVPEPTMQPQACADWGPWFCAPNVPVTIATIEWPKLPTEEIIYGPGPALAAPAFAYLGIPSPRASSHRASGGFGGVFLGGGDRRSRVREGDVVTTTTYNLRKTYNLYKRPPELPEAPAPVPLPGSMWALLAGLIGFVMLKEKLHV